MFAQDILNWSIFVNAYPFLMEIHVRMKIN